MELGGRALGLQPSALLTASSTGAAGAAQQVGDRRVLRREPAARVDDEEHDVGLGDRLPRLLGHLEQDAVRRHGLEAAGVDDEVLALAGARAAVVAIAREAGQVVHERVARLASAG